MKNIPILLLMTVLFNWSCQNNSPEEQGSASVYPSESGIVTVEFNERQSLEAGIVTGRLMKDMISIWAPATGMVDLPPDEIAAVYPRHEGYISTMNVLVGSKVRKGQVLAWYEHPDLIDMQMEFLKKEDEFRYQDSVLLRERALATAQAIPEKQVQAAELARERIALELEAMRQKLTILGLEVDRIRTNGLFRQIPLRTTIDGFVESVGINPGMYITPETQCFRIYGNKHQHIELTVFRDQLVRIREGQLVRFRIHGEKEEHDGEVFLVAPAIDPNSTTASIHVHFDEELHQLAPGTRIEARIEIERDSAFTIPNGELIRVGARHRLFIKEQNGYQPVWVETGREGDNWIEIVGPSSIFEQELVLQGNYFLQGSL